MRYSPSKRLLAVTGLLIATGLAPIAAAAVTPGSDAAPAVPSPSSQPVPPGTPDASTHHGDTPDAGAGRAPGSMPPRGAMFGRFPFGGPMGGPPPWFAHGPRDSGPEFDRQRHADPAMRLAGRLAALEVLVGIRSNQLDAWRDYTSALIDFLAPMRPAAQASAPDDKTPTLFGERLADGVLQRADKARKLKDATDALHKVLTSDQLLRLSDAQRRDRPGPDGWRGMWHGPHGGPQDDDTAAPAPDGHGMPGPGQDNEDHPSDYGDPNTTSPN